MQVNIYCKDLNTKEIYSYKGLNDDKEYHISNWVIKQDYKLSTRFNLFTAKQIIKEAIKKDKEYKLKACKYYIKPIKES